MLSSTIAFLRNAIRNHPDFPMWQHKIYQGHTIDNCSTKTLKFLALKLRISYHDDDKRGRPTGYSPKTGYTPRINPQPAPYQPTYPQEDDVTPYDAQPTIEPSTITSPPTQPTPHKDPLNALEAAIYAIVNEALKGFDPALNEGKVIDLIKTYANAPIERPLNITLADATSFTIPDGQTHFKFPLILSALSQKLNVYLVGPAGSGKTTLASQIAEALKVPFYGFAAMSSEYKMLGFVDAHGKIVCPQFRKAYTEGGLACLDEIDAYSPSALLALNSALANGWAEFPDGMGQRHPDFYCIAGANTVGTGLSRQYVGRNQLDAASIDRFVMIDLPYDAHLEAKIINANCFKERVTYSITPRELTSAHSTRIFEIMWAYRENIDALALQHVVSPRATMAALKLYGAGWAFADILQAVVRKGLPNDAWGKLNNYSIVSMCEGL